MCITERDIKVVFTIIYNFNLCAYDVRQVLYHRQVLPVLLLAGASQLVHTTGGLTASGWEPSQAPHQAPRLRLLLTKWRQLSSVPWSILICALEQRKRKIQHLILTVCMMSAPWHLGFVNNNKHWMWERSLDGTKIEKCDSTYIYTSLRKANH